MLERFDDTEIIAVRRHLEGAIHDLQAFLDPDNDSCNVSREARIEAREFLATWVLGPVNNADRIIENRVNRNKESKEREAATRKANRHMQIVK